MFKNVKLPFKVIDFMFGKHANIDFIVIKWHYDLHSMVNFSVTDLTILSIKVAYSKSLLSKM